MRQPVAGRRNIFFFILLFVTSGISLAALVVPVIAPLSGPPLEVGLVAPQDILAPGDTSYASAVLTSQQLEAAARAVAPIYTATDTSIARRQLEELRTALAFITSVRADQFAQPEQKLADLASLENLQLSKETAAAILDLNDSRWQVVQQEAIVVLEQVMRSTIREDRLDDARRTAPNLVSLSLPEEQAGIVSQLVPAFITPNSFYSEELTETARQKARDGITPVMRTFQASETVVRRGQVLRDLDMEALQEMGLVQPVLGWKELASAAALVFLGIGFTLFYLRRNTRLLKDTRALTLIAVMFLVFLISARLVIRSETLIPYVFPLAAFGLTTAALFGVEPALISTLSLSILAAYGMPNSLDLTLYYALSSFFGILTLGRARRMLTFFWAGAVVAGCGAILATAYRLSDPDISVVVIATITGAALLNGIASASLTVLLQFFLAQFLGMTTALQLLEISRPDHPALQLILRNAPGTYQHSLQVANLAEQAAERVRADTLLTRVGALYHDIGKAQTSAYYIENQLPGSHNPHDSLDPYSSADIIRAHVTEGVALARKYRLPSRIQDFILEHHGTMLARYQYVNAVKAAGGDEARVDQDLFRYPGPRPRTRETAILMLADGSEARVRAAHPKDEAELHELVKTVIRERVASGQLDDTNLTLRDLDTIAESFTTTLRGIYHPRIEYPRLDKPANARLDTSPTVPTPRVLPDGAAASQPDTPMEVQKPTYD